MLSESAIQSKKAGGGAGASNFLGLTDTPGSYAGQAGKFPQVNPGMTSLQFADVSAGAWSVENIVLVDPGEPEITGKRYQSIANAKTYCNTQVPSATNKWGILFSGNNAENIVMTSYVYVIGLGESARLTGPVDSGALSGMDYFEYLISGCEISDLHLTGTAFLILFDSIIWGSSSTGGNELHFYDDCLIFGGDFSNIGKVSTNSPIVLNGGIYPAQFQGSHVSISGSTLNGLDGSFVSINSDCTLNDGDYYLSYSKLKVSHTVNAGDSLNLRKCDGNGNTITNNGGTINLDDCIDLTLVGVINNKGAVLDTSNFTKNLTVADIEVQHAMETIDQLGFAKELYDIVIDRADYASDVLAGAALVAALINVAYRSMWIMKGTYDISAAGAGINCSSKIRISGEGANKNGILGVRLTSTVASGSIFTNFTNYCLTENVSLNLTSTATAQLVAFDDNNNNEAIFRNVHVYFNNLGGATTIGFLGIGQNTSKTFCEFCKTWRATQGFVGIYGHLLGCDANNIAHDGYYNCINLVDCKTIDLDDFNANNVGFHACKNLSSCQFAIPASRLGTGYKYAYSYCEGMAGCSAEPITPANSITSNDNNAIAFHQCTGMSDCRNYINLIAFSIAGSFYRCEEMTSCFSDVDLDGNALYDSHYYACIDCSACKAKISTELKVQHGFRGSVANSSRLSTAKGYSACRVIFDDSGGAVDHNGFYNCEENSACIVEVINTSHVDQRSNAFNQCNGVHNCIACGYDVNGRLLNGFLNCSGMIGNHVDFAGTCFNTCEGALNTGMNYVTLENACTVWNVASFAISNNRDV